MSFESFCKTRRDSFYGGILSLLGTLGMPVTIHTLDVMALIKFSQTTTQRNDVMTNIPVEYKTASF